MRLVFAAVFMIAALASAGAGVFALGSQILGWLQTGVWTPIPVIVALQMVSTDDWLRNPQTWLGVHYLLEIIPYSSAAFTAGIVTGCVAVGAWLMLKGEKTTMGASGVLASAHF